MIQKESLQKADMVRRLHPDAIDFFANTRIADPISSRGKDMRVGKFVRLGNVVFIASTQEYGEPINGRYMSMFHGNMASYAKSTLNPEELEVAERLATTGQALEGNLISDAGFTLIDENESTRQYLLLIGGASKEFGRADEQGRQITLDLARTALLPTVEVIET